VTHAKLNVRNTDSRVHVKNINFLNV